MGFSEVPEKQPEGTWMHLRRQDQVRVQVSPTNVTGNSTGEAAAAARQAAAAAAIGLLEAQRRVAARRVAARRVAVRGRVGRVAGGDRARAR